METKNKLQFVSNELNQYVDLYCENTKDVQALNIELCEMLEFQNERLIHKLGITELNGVKVSFNSLDEWNKQFIEFDDINYDVTSMEEIEELYQAICKFEEKQNSNFNNLIENYVETEFQAIIKDSLKYGRIIYSDEKYLLK
jgi:hypothetical protein